MLVLKLFILVFKFSYICRLIIKCQKSAKKLFSRKYNFPSGVLICWQYSCDVLLLNCVQIIAVLELQDVHATMGPWIFEFLKATSLSCESYESYTNLTLSVELCAHYRTSTHQDTECWAHLWSCHQHACVMHARSCRPRSNTHDRTVCVVYRMP